MLRLEVLMRFLSLFAVSLSLPAFALAIALAVRLAPPPERTAVDRSLTMTGDATVGVAPDLARVALRVRRDTATENEARRALVDPVTRVLEVLAQGGVEPSDVQTTDATVEARTTPLRSGMDRVIGYRGTRNVTICVHDLSKLGTILDLTAPFGLIESITYDASDVQALKDRARLRAAEAARAKAQMLVDVLGAHLGPPRTISEGGANWSGGYAWKNSVESNPSGAVITRDVATGLMHVDASVSVVFDILP